MKKLMKIQVLGSGCPNCKKLFEQTKKMVEELKLNTEVEYITDVAKIIEMGVMTSPILAVNGQPILTGSGHKDEDIKNALQKSTKKDNAGDCGCCCGNC